MPNSAETAFLPPPIEPPVLAWLGAREFALARQTPGFALWSNHREFAAERDALYIGYGAAGLTPRRQRVAFGDFQRWTRLTGAPLDLDALDEFAAHCRWRAERPQARVVGRFGAPGDPEHNVIAVADAQCIRVRPEVYFRWRDAFGKTRLLPTPSLDDYAAHVAECCLSAPRRPRRPAVRSS